MPKVTAEHVESRRAQIVAGARRAFARWGYDGATVPKLEREIGLSHGAIFNYFPSKLDLFVAVAHEDHERFHRIWAERGFAETARHIAAVDPSWLAVYFELHRRLYTDPDLKRAWRKAFSGEAPHDHSDEELFTHVLLNGLVFIRAAGADIDVEPIVRLAAKSFD